MTDEPTDETPDDGIRLDDPPPPPGALDRAREAALSAYDETYPAAGPGPGVGDLAAARAEHRWYQRVPLGAVAAAVVVVALVGVFTQADFGSESDDTATAVAEDAGGFEATGDAGTRAGESSAGREADGSGGAVESTTGALSAGPREYPDADAFVDDLRTRFVEPASASNDQSTGDDSAAPDEYLDSTTTSGGEEAESCDAVSAAGVDRADAVALVLATVDGREMTAVVYETSDGLRAALVEAASCSVADDRAL